MLSSAAVRDFSNDALLVMVSARHSWWSLFGLRIRSFPPSAEMLVQVEQAVAELARKRPRLSAEGTTARLGSTEAVGVRVSAAKPAAIT